MLIPDFNLSFNLNEMSYYLILCNREITEIFTDFIWISLVLKGLVGKLI